MAKKYTQEEIKEKLKNNNCELLSEYKNNTSKLKLRCKCGEIFYKSFKIMNGSNHFMCNECVKKENIERKKISYEEAKIRLKSKGFNLLCDEKDYNGFTHKYKVECSEGHVREQYLTDIERGHRCKICMSKINGEKCKLTYDDVKKFIESKNLILLSKEYKGIGEQLDVQCPQCETIFHPRLNNLKRGSGCPNCYNKVRGKLCIIPYETRKVYVESFGFKLITPKKNYVNGDSEVIIQCDKGHQYPTKLNAFYSGARCPICKNSKGEVKISQILDKNNIKYMQQYRFEDCKFYRTLPFDFYIPEYNICIEFDGKQHYIIGGFGRDIWEFVDIKIRDTIKTEYCKNKNIYLIRIPYWEINNMEDIIKKEIINI